MAAVMQSTAWYPVADREGRLIGHASFKAAASIQLQYTVSDTGVACDPNAWTLIVVANGPDPPLVPFAIMFKPAYVRASQDVTVHVGSNYTPSLVLRTSTFARELEITEMPVSLTTSSKLMLGQRTSTAASSTDRSFSSGHSPYVTRLRFGTTSTTGQQLVKVIRAPPEETNKITIPDGALIGAGTGAGAGAGTGAGGSGVSELVLQMRTLGTTADTAYGWCIKPVLRDALVERLGSRTSLSVGKPACSPGVSTLKDALTARHGVTVVDMPQPYTGCRRDECARLCDRYTSGGVYGVDRAASYCVMKPKIDYVTDISLTVTFVTGELPPAMSSDEWFTVQDPPAPRFGDTRFIAAWKPNPYESLAVAMAHWLCTPGAGVGEELMTWAREAPRQLAPTWFQALMDAVSEHTERASSLCDALLADLARTGAFSFVAAVET